MASTKLNPKGSTVSTNIQKVAKKHGLELGVSANGNIQFKKEPLQMLYEIAVSTMFGKATFYKSSDQILRDLRSNLKEAVGFGAYDFIANLAVHARTEMNIRTIPIVLVVEFAKALSDLRTPILDAIATIQKKHKGFDQITNGDLEKLIVLRAEADKVNYVNMRQLVCDVIQRADQINDLYAYALEVFGGKNKVPMAIKRGVADAFNKFGEYHFAKYNRDTTVKFRDVLRIVHPEAKDQKQGFIFEKIMKEQLETPYTWETELSKNGQRPVAERLSDADLWTQLIQSGKLGYQALRMNLRNIIQAGVDAEIISSVAKTISDPTNVVKSKQLPFEFIKTYHVIKGLNSKIATAVSKAIDASVGNLPQLGKRVWIIVDFSGSMGHAESDTSFQAERDSVNAITTATFLAAAQIKANADADQLAVTVFGSDAKTLKGVDTNNSVLAIQKELLSHRKGAFAGSTNFRAALAQKATLGFEPDVILVCTDGEVNGFPYATIKNIAGKNVMKLAINFSGAPTTPMPKEEGWFFLAGFSSAMFKWVPAMQRKETAVDQLSGPYKRAVVKTAVNLSAEIEE